MLQRLIYMSNAHLQQGRFHQVLSANCGQNGYDKRRINFPRPYGVHHAAPVVFVSIFQYDLCYFGGYNRALTMVTSVDATGFVVVSQTWSDTRLYALGIEVCLLSICLLVICPPHLQVYRSASLVWDGVLVMRCRRLLFALRALFTRACTSLVCDAVFVILLLATAAAMSSHLVPHTPRGRRVWDMRWHWEAVCGRCVGTSSSHIGCAPHWSSLRTRILLCLCDMHKHLLVAGGKEFHQEMKRYTHTSSDGV